MFLLYPFLPGLVAASCPAGLMALIQGEKLMIGPSTADGIRAAVSAVRSNDGVDIVSFQTFRQPQDRCVRIMVKNVSRVMPENVIRVEL